MLIEVDLPRAPIAASVARQHMHAIGSRLSRRQRQDAALALSELVTNAYRHGRGRIRLRLEAVGGGLRAEVMDEGPGFAAVVPQGWDGGGVGLRLVDR